MIVWLKPALLDLVGLEVALGGTIVEDFVVRKVKLSELNADRPIICSVAASPLALASVWIRPFGIKGILLSVVGNVDKVPSLDVDKDVIVEVRYLDDDTVGRIDDFEVGGDEYVDGMHDIVVNKYGTVLVVNDVVVGETEVYVTVVGIDDRVLGVDSNVVCVDDSVFGVDDSVLGVDDTVVGVDDVVLGVDDIVVNVDDTVAGADDAVVVLGVDDIVLNVDDTVEGVDDVVTEEENSAISVDNSALGVDDIVENVDDTVVGVDDSVLGVVGIEVNVDETVIEVGAVVIDEDDFTV